MAGRRRAYRDVPFPKFDAYKGTRTRKPPLPKLVTITHAELDEAKRKYGKLTRSDSRTRCARHGVTTCVDGFGRKTSRCSECRLEDSLKWIYGEAV